MDEIGDLCQSGNNRRSRFAKEQAHFHQGRGCSCTLEQRGWFGRASRLTIRSFPAAENLIGAGSGQCAKCAQNLQRSRPVARDAGRVFEAAV